ncbi:MAG TPA: DUF1572 domain-containing protein [Saprospiraceae bacterium]|nr:DUF1572 domain-containing protein [Saprospiraceae bacterium]
MNPSQQIAKHFRDVHFGGNWTSVHLKAVLSDVDWKQATTPVYDFNTIATLVNHTGYYVKALIDVLQGKALVAKDQYSFKHPPIQSEEDWKSMQDKVWANAEQAATLIGELPEARLWENFADEKYGNYYRNIHGMIEHLHYHLGQIVLIRKILLREENK